MRSASEPVEGSTSTTTPEGRISKSKKAKPVYICTHPKCRKVFTSAATFVKHERRHFSALASEPISDTLVYNEDSLGYVNQLTEFHQRHGDPLDRLLRLDKRQIDLYELKKAVEVRGGFADVCNDQKWTDIAHGLGYSGKDVDDAGVGLKHAYQRWLNPYEIWLKHGTPGTQLEARDSVHQAYLAAVSQEKNTKDMQHKPCTDEPDGSSIQSLAHPSSQAMDWSILPSSRNSIFPTITAFTSSRKDYTVGDLPWNQFSTTADNCQGEESWAVAGYGSIGDSMFADTYLGHEHDLTLNSEHHETAAKAADIFLTPDLPFVSQQPSQGISMYPPTVNHAYQSGNDQQYLSNNPPDNELAFTEAHLGGRESLVTSKSSENDFYTQPPLTIDGYRVELPEDIHQQNDLPTTDSGLSKCDLPGCCNRKTFDSLSTFNKHRLRHFRNFSCPIDDCEYTAFQRKDLRRHIDSVHGKPKYPCPYEECPYSKTGWQGGLFRKDALMHHLESHKTGHSLTQHDEASVPGNDLTREEPQETTAVDNPLRYNGLPLARSTGGSSSNHLKFHELSAESSQQYETKSETILNEATIMQEPLDKGSVPDIELDSLNEYEQDRLSYLVGKIYRQKHSRMKRRSKAVDVPPKSSPASDEELTTDVEGLGDTPRGSYKTDPRPEKCPIVGCEYHKKGFARKFDKNRHTLTHYRGTLVCGFCPGSGTGSEKRFNRVDTFKRHLVEAHAVEQRPPNSHRPTLNKNNVKLSSHYFGDPTGKCSNCRSTFNNAQDFYEHLDSCTLNFIILQILQAPLMSSQKDQERLSASEQISTQEQTKKSSPVVTDMPMKPVLTVKTKMGPVDKKIGNSTQTTPQIVLNEDIIQDAGAPPFAPPACLGNLTSDEPLEGQLPEWSKQDYSKTIADTSFNIEYLTNMKVIKDGSMQRPPKLLEPISLSDSAPRVSDDLEHNGSPLLNGTDRLSTLDRSSDAYGSTGKGAPDSATDNLSSDIVGGSQARLTTRPQTMSKVPFPLPLAQSNEVDQNFESTRLFACPYAKFDPLRYSESNASEIHYRGCAGGLYRDISRIKQHLKRLHHRPKFYCASCFGVFNSDQDLQKHETQTVRCNLAPICPFPEKLNWTQQSKIHVKWPSMKASDMWYEIFKIIFPGAPLPSSPYVEVAQSESKASFVQGARPEDFQHQGFFENKLQEQQDMDEPQKQQQEALPQSVQIKKKHRETRAGCVTCKAKSVKCGEEQPICHNCRVLDRKCYYRPITVPKASVDEDEHLKSPIPDNENVRPETTDDGAKLPHLHDLDLSLHYVGGLFTGVTGLKIGSWRHESQHGSGLCISFSVETERITYHLEYETLRYKMLYPFGYIRDITWFHSSAGTIRVVVELTTPPSFFMGGPGGDYKRGDFTGNQQASQILTHHWDGHSNHLISQISWLKSLPQYQQRFERFMPSKNGFRDTHTEIRQQLTTDNTSDRAEQYSASLKFVDLKFPPSRISTINGGETETLPITSVPTDSGYASLVRDKLQVEAIEADTARLSTMSQATDEDMKTVYSDGASVETSQRDSFVDRLAELLKQSLKDIDFSDHAAHEIFDDIKDCLADFAIRLGQENSSPRLRRAMAFVHKYRSLVGTSFKNVLVQGTNEEEDVKKGPTDNMPLGELMSRWFNNRSVDPPTSVVDDPVVAEDEIDLDDLILHEDNPNELEIYSDLISASESYKWLTSRLRNKILLTYEHSDAFKAIRKDILMRVPKEVVVKVGTASKVVQAVFGVHWPLQEFLELQLQPDSETIALGNIVSLTGIPPDIQLMTCNDYMRQTWPTTGPHLIRAVQESLNNESLAAEIQRPDGALLAVIFERSLCTISISGSRDMVVELAEQLSWLSTALRSSLSTKDMMICSPVIHARDTISRVDDLDDILDTLCTSRELVYGRTHIKSNYSRIHHFSRSRSLAINDIHIFELSFNFLQADLQSPGGNCWQHVLPHCCIVGGFPIRRRIKSGLGMEIPLKIMAGLVGTNRVNQYRETVFIRGFSAIYAPTELTDDTVTWHLTCDKIGGHVSYRDVPEDVKSIQFRDLEDKRHIVGWCTNIMDRIGTDSVVHPVVESQLPVTKPGCVLDNFLLTFPKEIAYGPSFALLECQKSIHLASATYRAKLRHLRDHFAMFWDTENDRGWLTNCLAAFLHLVRDTFVSYDAVTKEELMLLWGKLRLIAQTISTNQSLEPATYYSSWPSLDHERSTSAGRDDASVAEVAHQIFTRVCDQLFDGLDKLITFQEQVEYDDSRGQSRSLRLLEGWSFPDLASEHGSKRARVMSLPTIAFPWAKLLRSLGTVTIFGERFGELLSPCQSSHQSHSSQTNPGSVPTMCRELQSSKFLVATAMRDLRVKMRKFKHCTGSLLIGDAAIIPRYATAFTGCARQSRPGKCTHGFRKPVLMPWPAIHRKLLAPKSQCQCENVVNFRDFAEHYVDGAIILGHDDESGYYLDEAGTPIKGTPPDPAIEQEESFNDSGFGTDSSRISQENIVSRVTTRSTDEASAHGSGVFLKDRAQSYNDSVVNGGNPIYGNVYVTNNHHTVAASQTSYLGMRSTPTPNQQQLSVPALLNWAPSTIEQGNSRLPSPQFLEYDTPTGSKRSLSYQSESSNPAKRRRLSPPTNLGVTDFHTSTSRSRSHHSSADSSQSSHTIAHHSPALFPHISLINQVKRCCRCRTAMSVENPTEECEECIHEFCVGCGVLEDER